MNIMNLGPNDWVSCPFDPVHRMKYSRFHNHFVECRKKHPDDRRKQCPYNASELIEIDDYENHISECPYQSLYFNVGQICELQEYDAPSHFTIDENQSAVRKNRSQDLDLDSDLDDEFESVSMAGSRFNQRQSLPYKEIPKHEPASPKFAPAEREKSAVKKGFGRGAWIRQMLEQQKRSSPGTSSSSDESLEAVQKNLSSDNYSNNHVTDLIERFNEDPFCISKEFGRGRGAIFRSLLRD